MRELTLIVNVMNGKNGDMLECAKYYSIKKEENGKIVCVFKKRNAEAWSVKMTLTALEPYTRFEVRVGNQIHQQKAVFHKYGYGLIHPINLSFHGSCILALLSNLSIV